jgi:ADP-ribosylglycohydrolase
VAGTVPALHHGHERPPVQSTPRRKFFRPPCRSRPITGRAYWFLAGNAPGIRLSSHRKSALAHPLSALTHWDPDAGEACVLWCHAIRHAVLTGALDARAGLARLPEPSRARWAQRLDDAERARPRDFTRNGWVVEALQAAWCAIATTPVPDDAPADGEFRASHLRLALENAVRGGRDADTVAAIAGGLLGAAYGASAIPEGWRLLLHGWPGLRSQHLADMAIAIVRAATGRPVDGAGSGSGGRRTA